MAQRGMPCGGMPRYLHLKTLERPRRTQRGDPAGRSAITLGACHTGPRRRMLEEMRGPAVEAAAGKLPAAARDVVGWPTAGGCSLRGNKDIQQ